MFQDWKGYAPRLLVARKQGEKSGFNSEACGHGSQSPIAMQPTGKNGGAEEKIHSGCLVVKRKREI